jgi:hypothetical protein
MRNLLTTSSIVAVLFLAAPASAQERAGEGDEPGASGAPRVSLRIAGDRLELLIPGKEPLRLSSPAALAAAFPGLEGSFAIEALAPPPSAGGEGAATAGGAVSRIEPPGRIPRGQRIDMLRGKIAALDLLRFLADYTGVPVVHDANDRALAANEIVVVADVLGADDTIVLAHLAASGIRVVRRRLFGGKEIFEVSTAQHGQSGAEVKPTPIVVVGEEKAGSARDRSRPRDPSAHEGGAPRGSREDLGGIAFSEVPEMVAAQVELPAGEGVFVFAVDERDRERRGGLRVLEKYDIVTRVGERVVRSPRDLIEELGRYETGQELTLRYMRRGVTTIVRIER